MIDGNGDGRARALMVLGTASHVGKSLVTDALCQLFADRRFDVAPFKAQNISLEAAVTPDGREIGRAQAPAGEAGAQIVVAGRVLARPKPGL